MYCAAASNNIFFPSCHVHIIYSMKKIFESSSVGFGGSGGTQKRIMYNFLDSFLSEVFHNDVIASALLR